MRLGIVNRLDVILLMTGEPLVVRRVPWPLVHNRMHVLGVDVVQVGSPTNRISDFSVP